MKWSRWRLFLAKWIGLSILKALVEELEYDAKQTERKWDDEAVEAAKATLKTLETFIEEKQAALRKKEK